MSIKVMSMVWASDLRTMQRFVLLKLADHANDEGGNVYPSVATVAADTGTSARQVQRILGQLVAMGLLRIQKYAAGGRGHSRRYVIDLEALAALGRARLEAERVTGCHPFGAGDGTDHNSADNPLADKDETGLPTDRSPGSGKGDSDDTLLPAKGDIRARKGDIRDRKGCQSLSPEPSGTIKNLRADARAREEGAPAPAPRRLEDEPFGRAMLAVCTALGIDYLPARLHRSMSAIEAWLDAGAYPDPDIIGAVRGVAEAERATDPAWQPGSLHAFTDAVLAAVADRSGGSAPRDEPAAPREETIDA